jgi:uncharacterized membrane protein
MFDDFLSLILLVGVVVLVVVVARQNGRLRLMEREIGALRSFVLSMPFPGSPTATVAQSVAQAEVLDNGTPAESAPMRPEAAPAQDAATLDVAAGKPAEDLPEPQSDTSPPPTGTLPHAAPRPARPDLETALGTRWAVWVGGVALALGGVFLVRYSIEAGWFGPATRLMLAALFGLVLLVAAELIRRRAFQVPVDGLAGAYIPAVLTAAGAFTLFGTTYAAHAVYGFIGPGPAFLLLGLIGVGTVVLALIHGQALAGVGLLGALITPVLVSSESPNAWALFGYLVIVVVATVAVARVRQWRLLASLAFGGLGFWILAYVAEFATPEVYVLWFACAAMLAALALIWMSRVVPGPTPAVSARLFPSAVPAFFVGLLAAALSVDVSLQGLGGLPWGVSLFVGMLAIAIGRAEALPLLYGAAIGFLLCLMRLAFVGRFEFDVMGQGISVDGFPIEVPPSSFLLPALGLAALFLASGIWQARRMMASPTAASSWATFSSIVSVAAALCLWLSRGNPDVDIGYALATLLLSAVLVAGAEWVARGEAEPLSGGPAVSFLLAGAGAALMLAIHMGFGPALTTILSGAAAVLPALATRWRRYPALGWLAVTAVVVVLARIAIDPTIVGAERLTTTPVFNVLLPGYGVPALVFAVAAWQLARTTGGRPWLSMQAGALLFALLTVGMLVRHAMNGGVIDTGIPTLAEQSIYSLIALGAGAILISLDLRSPSSVLRWASIGIGVLSCAVIAIQHVLLLNPLFTNEATGAIPVFNLLFLAYLLPAIAAGGVAWYARTRRPHWYSMMLGITAAALGFFYPTLSVRRLFKGQYIGYWSGMEQLETYSYSALWLVMGVVLLVVGVRSGSFLIRSASGALIAIAVAKVFLFDMSELEGVLRALSFIGLGAVLIGIGLFYQRLLRRSAA